MDRAWIEVYFAVDSQPITAEEISALVEGDADIGSHRLGLCASTSLVSLNYGVTEIWQTLKAKHHLNDVTKLSKKSAYALIWRQHASVLIRPLPSAEFIFLSSLNAGSNLGQAAELAMEEDADFDLADLFSNLITASLLTTTATQALQG